jgi:sulfur relay (sulfurtransferase) DsrC/TusE family protein
MAEVRLQIAANGIPPPILSHHRHILKHTYEYYVPFRPSPFCWMRLNSIEKQIGTMSSNWDIIKKTREKA